MNRLFEKFQQKSSRAKHIRIRLIEPCVDIDSLIKSLSETLATLREQDPVLLHIDTAGVSVHAFISAGSVVPVLVVPESLYSVSLLIPVRFVQAWRSCCSVC